MSVRALLRPGPHGFWVEVPALPGCATWGKTRDLALESAYEVVERAVEAYRAMGVPVPWQPEPAEVPAGVEVESLHAYWDEPLPPIDCRAIDEAHARGEYLDLEDVLRDYGVDVRRQEP